MSKPEIAYLTELEDKVKKIIEDAAIMIKDVAFDVDIKTDCTNVVTSSDLLVQHFLRENLRKILPEAGFFCEEEGLQETCKEYIWIIDPIDGTTNYSRGIPECAISVALLHEGQVVVGIVYNIWTGDCYTAIAQEGAKCNGKKITVSGRSFEEGLFCTAMSTYRKELAVVCNDIIFDVYMQCNDVRRFGSCALELCYLAEGKCELYFEIRVFPWDYAAAGLILKEAGGELSSYKKDELIYDKPTVLVGANNYKNHKRLHEIVCKYLKEQPKEN